MSNEITVELGTDGADIQIELDEADYVEVNAGPAQGVPGPPGPTGPAGSIKATAIAGATISSYTAVVIVGGLLYPADITNVAHGSKPVYVATQSGLSGAPIDYQQAGDIVGTGFVADQRYCVGLNGVLVPTYRNLGATWGKFIGIGKSSTVLSVEMDDTILF